MGADRWSAALSGPRPPDSMKRSLLLAALVLALLPHAARAAAPSIVIMIGEEEYHTWETLPQFAKSDLEPLGYRVTLVVADAADKNNFPGLVEALRDADLLFLSVRRRTPHAAQLDAVRAYLASGRPLVGIRTACHAFIVLGDRPTDGKLEDWPEFGPEVIGSHYTRHYNDAPMTRVTVVPGAEGHPILRGVSEAALGGATTLYAVNPLAQGAVPLLVTSTPGHPGETVAWTHAYGPNRARVFYTQLGAPNDFQNPEFRRLLANGVAWALGNPGAH
jgi:type 1 glutamine amidotransferase